uniref:Shedu immune nuclease family protein n=1 Tax=Paludisphaera soli TaxID=2712865 RepID=UPI0013ECC5F3
FQAVALTKLHEIREAAVNEFFEKMESDWQEADWQAFFKRNTWIFGYSLDYRFVSSVVDQPYYGGKQVTGRDGQRGDFLAASEADHRFTVLVEIKRPDSLLVDDELYRNKVHRLGDDLVGGVAQLQSSCRTWEVEGSRTDDNRERMREFACHTLQPKGILIIGCTTQLDDQAKRSTFELFRRNLQNPEIITFDELHERARHLLLIEGDELSRSSRAKTR